MGLQLIWSFGLACLDVYAIRRKSDLRSPILLSLFTVGDWVLNLSSISLYAYSLLVSCCFKGYLFDRFLLEFCRSLHFSLLQPRVPLQELLFYSLKTLSFAGSNPLSLAIGFRFLLVYLSLIGF